jgi:hypothetical protein
MQEKEKKKKKKTEDLASYESKKHPQEDKILVPSDSDGVVIPSSSLIFTV